MLQHVEICSDKIIRRVSEIAHNRKCFQKYFRKDHSRSDVEHSAPIPEVFHRMRKNLKIPERQLTGRRTVHSGLLMDDICSDCGMNGNRNIQSDGGGQN